jgi:hypothetical protein
MDVLSESISSRKLNVKEGLVAFQRLKMDKEVALLNAARRGNEPKVLILSTELDRLAEFRDKFLLEFGQEILEGHRKKKVLTH